MHCSGLLLFLWSFVVKLLCILGHAIIFPAFTEPLQQLKMFCSFIGSLSLKMLSCEVAQLHHDYVFSASGLVTSSTAIQQTESSVTAQTVPARFNRVCVSELLVKIMFNSQSTISIFVVHSLRFLLDMIVFRTLKSFYFYFAIYKRKVCMWCVQIPV